jgi:hypothetical protein
MYDADSGCTGLLHGDGQATNCNAEELDSLGNGTAARICQPISHRIKTIAHGLSHGPWEPMKWIRWLL